MKFSPNIENEVAGLDYTHRLDFSWQDIPAGIAANTSNTTWPITLPTPVAGDEVISAHLHVTEAFQNTADAAFNSTTVSLGDTNSATRFFSAVQVNANGSVVPDSTEQTDYIYTTPYQLVLTMNSMTAKSLSNLNKGKAYIEMKIFRPSKLGIDKGIPFGTGYV